MTGTLVYVKEVLEFYSDMDLEEYEQDRACEAERAHEALKRLDELIEAVPDEHWLEKSINWADWNIEEGTDPEMGFLRTATRLLHNAVQKDK